MGRVSEFVVGLLDRVEVELGGWDWGEVGLGLGVGTLNHSFLVDNFFLPHELHLMRFHSGKGYMMASEERSRALLMVKLLAKN